MVTSVDGDRKLCLEIVVRRLPLRENGLERTLRTWRNVLDQRVTALA
jgi:hypothetical protein